MITPSSAIATARLLGHPSFEEVTRRCTRYRWSPFRVKDFQAMCKVFLDAYAHEGCGFFIRTSPHAKTRDYGKRDHIEADWQVSVRRYSDDIECTVTFRTTKGSGLYKEVKVYTIPRAPGMKDADKAPYCTRRTLRRRTK